jgi:DtxR family Mn-dependent transcriptional regulator
MAELLGHPAVDPHGAPIPEVGRPFMEPAWPRLSEAPAGVRLVLRQVSDEDPEVLRYLERLGLMPGKELRILGRAPMRGPLSVEVDGAVEHIGAELANELRVAAVGAVSPGRKRRPGRSGRGEKAHA